MDVVGVEGMTDPFSPRIEAGRLYGRGGYDMKGGLAAIMLAAARVAGAGLRGDVIVTGVCDEEYASIGSEAIATPVRADAAIVTEPTGLQVCVAHKGFLWLEIETKGVAAHGSRPDLGVDATRPLLDRATTDPTGYLRDLAAASEAAELISVCGLGDFYWLVSPSR